MRIFNVLKNLLTSVDTIMSYFKLKDVVLWSGSAGQGDSITVPNLDKYNIISVQTSYNENLCDIRNGRLRIWQADYNTGDFSVHYDTFCIANITNNIIDIHMLSYLAHNAEAGHSSVNATSPKIVKIVGVEPKLTPIFGGGEIISFLTKWNLSLPYA